MHSFTTTEHNKNENCDSNSDLLRMRENKWREKDDACSLKLRDLSLHEPHNRLLLFCRVRILDIVK